MNCQVKCCTEAKVKTVKTRRTETESSIIVVVGMHTCTCIRYLEHLFPSPPSASGEAAPPPLALIAAALLCSLGQSALSASLQSGHTKGAAELVVAAIELGAVADTGPRVHCGPPFPNTAGGCAGWHAAEDEDDVDMLSGPPLDTAMLSERLPVESAGRGTLPACSAPIAVYRIRSRISNARIQYPYMISEKL